jgi:hypothetical protein
MKTPFLSLWLSAFIFHVSAADAPPAPQTPPKRQAAKITAVATATDKRTLVIRYEIAGVASEERITFAGEVADFRYCPWMGDSGIAIVARTKSEEINGVSFSEDGQRVRLWNTRTGALEKTEYFYCTLYLSGTPKEHKPSRISAPQVINPVLGIGNTFGDSDVITAVQHRRSPADSISGWVYIDNCPLPGSGLAIGHITPFTIAAEQPQPK